MNKINLLAVLLLATIPLSANAEGDDCWGTVQRAAIAQASAEIGHSERCMGGLPEDIGDGTYDMEVTCGDMASHTYRTTTTHKGNRCYATHVEKID